MSWILPTPTPELRRKHYRESRVTYHRQWRDENRERINAYWRAYYKKNRAARRAYLNQKQREYRAKNK